MKSPHRATLCLNLASILLLNAQELDDAEVRISYGELKQLLARAEPLEETKTPPPALLSARLRLLIENGRPVVDATFRATSFDPHPVLVPIIAGDITIVDQEPEDARFVTEGNGFRVAFDQAGTHEFKLKLLPVIGENGFTVSLPPCPSAILETGQLEPGRAFSLSKDGETRTMTSGQTRALSADCSEWTIRALDDRETHAALRPPEPSTWTWQQETLVTPQEGDLFYQNVVRATAFQGSGVEAMLPLPSDARDIKASGEDLAAQSIIRGEDRSLQLALVWKTRGILDRKLLISYHMPLRPLDRKWKLEAPGGEKARTRFMIAASPLLAYAADGLSGPLASHGIPSVLAESLHGGTYQAIESSGSVDVSVTPIPVAATAEGVVNQSEWSIRVEPDGATLATGQYTIHHEARLSFPFDSPAGMKLLTCEVNGKPVSPVDLGEGRLQLELPPHDRDTLVKCSFTGRGEALDPVEGTMRLALPRTPVFIHSLLWQLDLPAGYQAETHGNLSRVRASGETPPGRIALRKNLCRDERPEIQVFYQRADIHR